MRILLAEDETTIAITLGDELEDAGHSVARFEDGRAAIAWLEQEPVDCVITDLRLPGASGLAVLEAARTKGAGLPVVVISAWASPEQEHELAACGAQFFRKPFGNDALVAFLAGLATAQGGAA